MTSSIAGVSIDARNTRIIAEFWRQALGWDIVEEADDGYVSLARRGTLMPTLDILPVPEGKSVKNRLHLDLRSDGSDQQSEVERLISLGATRADVGQGPDVTWVVLADPEGNEFCVLERSVQKLEADHS